MSKISLALPAWAPPLVPQQGRKSICIRLFFLVLALLISGCSQANNAEYSGANIAGINHTLQGINSFSVNGYGGGMTGNTCCVMLPDKWYPGMQAKIEWETDPKTAPPFPGYQDWDKYQVWEKQVKSSFQQHSAVVDIPQYDHACAFAVHFLVCNQVKVTTSCSGYGQPNYPIKEPLNMKEPTTCPK